MISEAATADLRGQFDDPGRIGPGASPNGAYRTIDDPTLALA